MSTDTFNSIWNEVHGHSKAVDPLLVQTWVRDTWREIAESRTWSWLRKKSLISIPAEYTTGTVTLTPGSTLVTFSGSTLSLSMVGLQFRAGHGGAIYDITDIDTVGGTAQIFPPWSGTTVITGHGFKIFTAYIVPPDLEFFAWIAVTDPKNRRRLRLHVNNESIDFHDSARLIHALGPACLSGLDWSRSYAGRIYPAIQILGTGPIATATGSYTGQTDSVFFVQITTGGVLDIAQFLWRKDNGTIYTNMTVSSSGNTLPEGIQLTWPAGTFVLGDAFYFRLSSRPQYGYPRYELYPHPHCAMVLPCTYATRVQDIDSPGFVLPYTMRGDVIKLGALAKMARYPGTDTRPNPFAQIARATSFEEKFQDAVAELNTADDYIMETNVSGPEDQWDHALLPWMNMSGAGLRPTQTSDPWDLTIFQW